MQPDSSHGILFFSIVDGNEYRKKKNSFTVRLKLHFILLFISLVNAPACPLQFLIISFYNLF